MNKIRRGLLQAFGLASTGGVTSMLAACGGGDNGGDLNVRLINLLADSGDVTLRVNGTDKTTASFETATGYVGQDSGTFTTDYVARSSGNVLSSESATYNKDVYYTKIGVGIDDSSGFITIADNEERPAENKVKVRLLNMVANGLVYDLYLTGAGVNDLKPNSPTVANIGPSGLTAYLTQASGGLRIRVTRAGTKDPIYDSGGAFDFSSRTVITLILYAKGSNELIGCFASFGKDNPSRSQVIPSALSRVRIVNGTDLTEPISIGVDGVGTFSGVSQNAASSYQVVSAGTRQVSVATASGTTLISNFAAALLPGRDHTLIVGGAANTYTLTLTQDPNTRARAGYVKLRVTNATRDGATAALSINFRTDFPSIPPASVTASREYTPSTSNFTGSFTINGVTKTVDFNSKALEDGKSYFATLLGDDASRTFLLTEV